MVRASLLSPWWRHQMKTFSALLAICAGNSPVTGEFPAQRPVTRSFDVFFDLSQNGRLSKQSWGWLFEMLSRPLWRQCNGRYCCSVTWSWNTMRTLPATHPCKHAATCQKRTRPCPMLAASALYWLACFWRIMASVGQQCEFGWSFCCAIELTRPVSGTVSVIKCIMHWHRCHYGLGFIDICWSSPGRRISVK